MKKSRIVALIWIIVKVVILLHLWFQWHGNKPSESNQLSTLSQGNSTMRPAKIPTIIHQSWKTKKLPKGWKKWSESWKRLNPDYEYKLWTDDDNYNLIKEHYSWFLPTYEAYDRPILKADAARVFYLHKYGGVYSDFDVIALKPIGGLLGDHDLLLAQMAVPPIDSDDELAWFYFLNQFPNAWMASKPGHSFWIFCANMMIKKQKDSMVKEMLVEEITGPMMLYEAYYDYIAQEESSNTGDPITIVEPKYIFPYSWSSTSSDDIKEICSNHGKRFNAEKCRAAVDPNGEAYAISYWAHSWDGPRSFWDRVLEYLPSV